MLPVLFELGFIKIYTSGVFLVLSLFWSAFFLWKNISLTSYKEEEIFDGLFLSLIGGLFIGRAIYVIINFSEFGLNILKFILITGYPGIYFFGFVFGFFLFWYIFMSVKKIPYRKCIDYIVPPFFLALGIGKIGAFFSGSEIGTQTKFIIALIYPNLDGARHLTSFYEGLLFFAGAYLTYKLIFLIRQEKLQGGFNLIFFIWAFSFTQSLLDPLKSFKIVIGQYSVDMVVSLVLLLTGSIYLLYYFRVAIFNFIKTIGRNKINN